MARELTHELLKELVHYDPDTGILTWLVQRGGVKAGSVAGNPKTGGYLKLQIFGRVYLVHRIAVFYVTGAWPSMQIDHKDGNTSNNRWCNLREATNEQNQHNAKCPSTNTSGVKGVHLNARDGKWYARVTRSGRRYHLGLFNSVQEAEIALNAARDRLHGEFSNNGQRKEKA